MEVEVEVDGEWVRFIDADGDAVSVRRLSESSLLEIPLGLTLTRDNAAELWPFLKRFAETGSMKEMAHSAEFQTREREIVEAIDKGRLATPGSWSDTAKRGYLLARQWRVDGNGFWLDPTFQYAPLTLKHAHMVATGQISRAGTSSLTYQPIELLSDTFDDAALEWLRDAIEVESMERELKERHHDLGLDSDRLSKWREAVGDRDIYVERNERRYAIRLLGTGEIFYRQLVTSGEIKKEANAQ